MLRSFLLTAVALLAMGCGGGSPLLHPARTLPTGEIRATGGVFANIVPGALGDDLRAAKDIASRDPAGTSSPGTPGQNPTYAKGALVAAAIGPGLAPFVSARVGVGNRFEGGLAYTGRGVRVDLRRSFESGRHWAFSLGAAGTAALYGRQQGTELRNVDLGKLRGYGFDIPLLAGWDSDNGLYRLWFGPRGGYERVIVDGLSSEPSTSPLAGDDVLRLTANRFFGGAVLGIATGFNHVHVALEASLAYQVVNGTYNANEVTVKGLTLMPATALWWTF